MKIFRLSKVPHLLANAIGQLPFLCPKWITEIVCSAAKMIQPHHRVIVHPSLIMSGCYFHPFALRNPGPLVGTAAWLNCRDYCSIDSPACFRGSHEYPASPLTTPLPIHNKSSPPVTPPKNTEWQQLRQIVSEGSPQKTWTAKEVLVILAK